MDSITQLLLQQLSSGGVTQISKKIGVDEKTASSALSMAMPLLVSALAKNSSKPHGAQALQKALEKDHDGLILENVAGYLEKPEAANGAGILGHVLGTQQPVIADRLAKSTGLKSEQVSQLMQIAAPLLMGALGKQQHQQGLDPNGVSALLGNEKQATQQAAPDLMSSLNTLLDTDGDGSALDDIMGFAGKLFGNK